VAEGPVVNETSHKCRSLIGRKVIKSGTTSKRNIEMIRKKLISDDYQIEYNNNTLQIKQAQMSSMR
jgi:hypothetical protein